MAHLTRRWAARPPHGATRSLEAASPGLPSSSRSRARWRLSWGVVTGLATLGLACALSPRSAGALSVVGIEPPARTTSERSCYDIAAEISALLDLRAGTPGFWARTDNQVATVMTIVAPLPALSYLGYNAYESLKLDRTAASAGPRIRELRRRSAEQQCFVR